MTTKPPVNIHAPIVTHAGTREGIQPFMDFIAGLKHNGNVATAKAESERLNPYFKSLSFYLKNAVPDEATDAIASPKALSRIFNDMAALTKNTLISEVAVMSSDIQQLEPAKYIFKDRGNYSVPFYHGHYSIEFGFLQVYADLNDPMHQSSTTFPTLFLDSRMMDRIKDHDPQAILKPLQIIMTMVNHDIMHHFTTPLINPNVAQRFETVDKSPLVAWDQEQVTRHSYETWSHMSHETALLQGDNSAQLIQDTKAHIDTYFDLLKPVGAEYEEKTHAHRIVDFFGMTMAHALTRLFPLDHEVIDHCITRLLDADPLPERTKLEMVFDVFTTPDTGVTLESCVKELAGHKSHIFRSYRDAGCDLSKADTPEDIYRNMKKVQLIHLSEQDVLAHTPLPAHMPLGDMRNRIATTMIKMVEAVNQTITDNKKANSKPVNAVNRSRIGF